ncbi:hypothetical protein [Bosea sp. LjRoot237]|uniref:hypothetical protein n=1 Tax=Bosea sp. LjRoot237 TaxID=3342292 RepID=UPI003ED14F9D
MELTIPAALALSVGTAGLTLAASWGVVKYQATQHEKRLQSLEDRTGRQAEELADFRLEAAQRFVTVETMAKLEERVISAIDRLADRLDRVIEGRVAPARRS